MTAKTKLSVHPECSMPSLEGQDVCIFHEIRGGKTREELGAGGKLHT